MEEILTAMGRDGHSTTLAERIAMFKEREEIVGHPLSIACDCLYATEGPSSHLSLFHLPLVLLRDEPH